MKSRQILMFLFAVGATSSLMSMEKGEKGRLNFVLDNSICITGYARHNMEFAVKPPEFLGKNILDVLPLKGEERKAISQAISDAITLKKATKAQYTLKDAVTAEEKKYIAKFTAFKTPDKFYNYFVKVQEAKQIKY